MFSGMYTSYTHGLAAEIHYLWISVYSTGDKIILHTSTEYNCEQPYSGLHAIIKTNLSGTATLQVGLTEVSSTNLPVFHLEAEYR